MRRVLAATVAALILTGRSSLAESDTQATRTVDAEDQAFGLRLSDPDRWMEGEENLEFTAWLKAEGATGRAHLDALQGLGPWRERLDQVAQVGVTNRLQQPAGGRMFFLRLQGGREGVLMARDRDGKERVLLDPSTRDSGSRTAAITTFSPSPDGRRVAANAQLGGSEITRIELIDAADGRLSPEVIEDVWGEFAANWVPDGSAFTYTQLAAPTDRDPMLNMRVRLHRLGSAVDVDAVLLARGTNPRVPLEPSEFPFIDPSGASPYALLVIGGARPQNRICVAPKAEALRPGARWHCLAGYDDNVQQLALNGDRLYLVSMRDHPNGQVISVDLRRAKDLRQGTILVPEDGQAVVTGMVAAGDALYARRMQGGPDKLLRLPYAGRGRSAIDLPFPGAIYLLAADPRSPRVVFTLQGWIRPRTAFRSASGNPPVDLHLGADAPGDYSAVVADELTATSADGTAVPLTLLRRGDAMPGGGGVALLEGYGAYGTSLQPYYDPFVLEWVKAGNVYAFAHVRGGGEKGDAWRIAGSRSAKERSVEDFIACANSLVASGWAKGGGVVAFGASAGGILIGGAITRAPELFGAAIIRAGMLNPSRLLAAKNGANQIAEVGDPGTAEGLRALAAMDPYQRIQDGAWYPSVLLLVGLNDNRVAPWASGKFGARLRAASASGKPVWFRTDDDLGHFSTAAAAEARESADLYAFAQTVRGED